MTTTTSTSTSRSAAPIKTFLWFEKDAEAAAELYTSIVPGSRILSPSRWGGGGPAPKGSVMSVAFELGGAPFIAFNGGPHYKLNPSVSLFAACETQDEVDRYWTKLLESGGKEIRCGWLVDRFGLSWQIIPNALMEWIGDSDPDKAGRVTKAMMGMQKIDIAGLRRAYAGE
jgi:predicted 3-demethylubiquinone-9 3-methyltransferase (glyoxalase superfamily)